MTGSTRKATNAHLDQSAGASELSADELNAVSGGVRKSAGNQSSGVMFLSFTFKQVAV